MGGKAGDEGGSEELHAPPAPYYQQADDIFSIILQVACLIIICTHIHTSSVIMYIYADYLLDAGQ